MMINTNYAEQIALAKTNKASFVNFDNNKSHSTSISGAKDTVSISSAALAKLNGADYQETAPTYIKPISARSLLEANQSNELNQEKKVHTDTRFSEMMQDILDKRLGIDRKKLEELDAMMEEIAKNENMSPEEKAAAMEKIAEMREKVIEESARIREVAKQTDHRSDDDVSI